MFQTNTFGIVMEIAFAKKIAPREGKSWLAHGGRVS
jgi:hypothetical protein